MNQNLPEFDVVIVGAGIAGSALACALNGSDLSVLMCEGGKFNKQVPECDYEVNGFDPRVCALTLASQRFLEELDVWKNIEALRANAFSDMYVWDGEGTGDIAFSASEVARQQLGHIVENRVIVHCLLQSLDMSSNVRMSDGMKVQSLDYDPYDAKYRHRVTFVNDSGEQRSVKAALVVGADGANSFVRKTCQFRTREWDYGHHGIVCTVQTEQSNQNTAWQRFMHTGPLALLPLASGELAEQGDSHFSSIVWSADVEEANRLMSLSDEEFQLALQSASEQRLGKIIASSQRFSFPLRQRHAVDYVKEGVALIADAAHTIHPLAGQGINLGLQDVAVLAEEIKRAKKMHHRIGDMRVLSRYQRRRKGDNLMMMGVMEGFKRVFAQESLMIGWLRNRGMKHIGESKLLKQQIMKQAIGI